MMTQERYERLRKKCIQMTRVLDDIIYELRVTQIERQKTPSIETERDEDGTVRCANCLAIANYHHLTGWECSEGCIQREYV